MKSLHIRDIDPGLVRKIKILAALHHRSMQGELKAIIEDAAKKVPESSDTADLDIISVRTGNTDAWKREDIYDDAR